MALSRIFESRHPTKTNIALQHVVDVQVLKSLTGVTGGVT